MQSSRDSVAALLREDQVAHVLSMVHRLGHGHHARLIRETGSSLGPRLRRCGVSQEFHGAALEQSATVVLIVDAPHQSSNVAELLFGLGAVRVERFQASSVASSVLAFDAAVLGKSRSRRRSSRDARH